jgi:hypothetical protein
MPCAGEDDYREAEQGSEIRPIPPPNPLQSFRQSLFSYRAVDVNHITGKDELIMITLLGQHICHPPAWLPPTVLAVPQGIDVQEIPIPTSNQTRMGFRGDWGSVLRESPRRHRGFPAIKAVVAIRTMAAIGFLPTSTIDFPWATG